MPAAPDYAGSSPFLFTALAGRVTRRIADCMDGRAPGVTGTSGSLPEIPVRFPWLQDDVRLNRVSRCRGRVTAVTRPPAPVSNRTTPEKNSEGGERNEFPERCVT